MFLQAPIRLVGPLVVAAGAFLLGLAGGSGLGSLTAHGVAPDFVPAADRLAHAQRGSTAYPAQVLKTIDGDTFEARVQVWPGVDITTKVRLRGIDTPELKARCAEERSKAESARGALASMLSEGGVEISAVGLDKFGGRVDADASSHSTPDIAHALIKAGLARAYAGGQRAGWCTS